jgi:uncharacterized membrane protein YdjX (TVP38/TMEM64 family)
LKKLSRRNVLRLILLATIFAAIVVLFWTEAVDLKAVQLWMQGLNPLLLIILMALLPLVGFSVSIVYLVAGAAFGGIAGFAVVTGATAVHLLGSHWLGTTFLRRPVTALLKRKHVRVPTIPPGEEWAVALLAVLTPGPPYFVRNYALALSGIPLRTYFWIAWPIYVLRSCLVIFLGDVGAALSPHRMVVLAGIFALKLSICAYIVYHVRRRYQALHPDHSHSMTAAHQAK